VATLDDVLRTDAWRAPHYSRRSSVT
jgi:hypothetical protein